MTIMSIDELKTIEIPEAMSTQKVWLLRGKYEGTRIMPIGIYSTGRDASIAARIFMMEIACDRDIYHPTTAPLPKTEWKQRGEFYYVAHVYGGIKFKMMVRPYRLDDRCLEPVDYIYEKEERKRNAC